MSFKVFFGSEFGNGRTTEVGIRFCRSTDKFERLLQILLNGKWCSAEACNQIEFYWNYMKDAKHAMV